MRLKFRQGILGFFVVLTVITTSSIAGDLLYGPDVGKANLSSNKGSIIVYRENTTNVKKTSTIFMNGDKVLGSLLPNEYLQTRVCSNKIKLRVATRGDLVTSGYSKTINMPQGKIVYIKVVETKKYTLVPVVVEESEGKKALNNITRTSHIINRYVPKMVFGSDGLFAFNSSVLLPSSRITMEKLAHDIQTCSGQLNRIKIIGHTDRIGSVAHNIALSKERAKSVAAYLSKQGVTIPINVEGRGSREPLTRNCRGKVSPRLIQCLQQDRRVEIELLDSSAK